LIQLKASNSLTNLKSSKIALKHSAFIWNHTPWESNQR